MIRKMPIRMTGLLLLALAAPNAVAQDAFVSSINGPAVPSLLDESVSQLSDRGMHFEAVTRFIELDEPTLQDKLSGARSAWALGLVDRARALWSESLSSKGFQDGEKPRAALARAILEFQEGNYDQARAYAEAAANTLPGSDLRAQFWLVIAEALKEQRAISLAEAYYKKAVQDGSGSVREEAKFLLGESQFRLGLLNDARYSFASVEAGSAYTAKALRRLVEIDLQQKNFDGVLTWVEEGRESHPTEFADGWMSYAHIMALTELGRLQEAGRELQTVRARLSDQNPWFVVAEAAVEGRKVAQVIGQTVAQRE